MQDQELSDQQADKRPFEIEPLEERIAPSAAMAYGFAEHHDPFVDWGNGQKVFLGYDPPSMA
jgi:hypothetical protein